MSFSFPAASTSSIRSVTYPLYAPSRLSSLALPATKNPASSCCLFRLRLTALPSSSSSVTYPMYAPSLAFLGALSDEKHPALKLALTCLLSAILLQIISENRIEIGMCVSHYRGFCRKTWSSPRPISTGQLNTLLHLHIRPIYLVFFQGPYFFRMGNLILELTSRLDAFSVYSFQT